MLNAALNLLKIGTALNKGNYTGKLSRYHTIVRVPSLKLFHNGTVLSMLITAPVPLYTVL
jgi:hypothetical protein